MPGPHREDVARVGVARVLHRDRGSGTDQQRGEEEQRLLGADRDHHLGGRHPDPASRQQAAADLLDEERVVAVDQVLRPALQLGGSERPARALPPLRDRKQRRIELAVEEGVGIALPVRRLDDVALLRRAGDEPPAPVDRGTRRCRRDRGLRPLDLAAYEIAAALARFEKAGIDEVLVGEHDGVARDPELLGELAARGHRGSRREAPVENCRDQHLPDAGLERPLAAWRQGEQLAPHGPIDPSAHYPRHSTLRTPIVRCRHGFVNR